MGFACGKTHSWYFVESLAKATAALTFTFNVCVAAWYVMKFYHGFTFVAVVVGLLALGWYFYLGLMTLGQFPAGRQALQAWSSGNK